MAIFYDIIFNNKWNITHKGIAPIPTRSAFDSATHHDDNFLGAGRPFLEEKTGKIRSTISDKKKGPDQKTWALRSPSDFAPRGNQKTGASELRRTDFPQPETRGKSGGAERDRTVGLLNAIQALSQLSYSPTSCNKEDYPITARNATAKQWPRGPSHFLNVLTGGTPRTRRTGWGRTRAAPSRRGRWIGRRDARPVERTSGNTLRNP